MVFIFNTFLLLDKWKQALIVVAKCFALLVILYMFICSLSFLASAFKLLGGKSTGKNLKIHSFSRRPRFSENVIFLWEIYIFQANYTLALCEKCPYSKLFWSAFLRIWTEYGEIRNISRYSVRMRENGGQNNSEYGHFSCSVVLMIPRIIQRFTKNTTRMNKVKCWCVIDRICNFISISSNMFCSDIYCVCPKHYKYSRID